MKNSTHGSGQIRLSKAPALAYRAPRPANLRWVSRLTALVVAGLLPAGTASTDAPGELMELTGLDQKPFARLEASGVAYHAGRLVVVDDTENDIFVFDTSGRLVSRIHSAQFPEVQAKFEDIAYDEKSGSYLAVGSHSGFGPEDLDRQSLLVEFRIRRLGAIDEKSIRTLPLREPFVHLGMWKPRAMKIEGLAVDARRQTLFVGLREPVDRARIYRSRLDYLRSGEPRLELALEFDAGSVESTPYCVSGLVWDSHASGLLIATSTEDDSTHEFLGNRLWYWTPGEEPVLLLDRFDVGRKAEGLALGAGRLFVIYDNDQDDTGIGSALRVIPTGALVARSEIDGRPARQ
ncbi:MAG TPA: hypothetical protein VLK65_12655 [Vicinamibacteria bacterium]|nr:hypothetical protein [Vicinamibacteria bacterium]